MASPLLLWFPVAGYALLIFLLSSASDLPSLPGGMSDKAAHALIYSGLGFLLARAIAGGLGRPLPPWTLPIATLLAVAYGVTDEFHQLFVPGRHFDLGDLAADGAGAAAGAVAMWLWGIICRFYDALR